MFHLLISSGQVRILPPMIVLGARIDSCALMYILGDTSEAIYE
jgi:hypothetical protein